MKSFKKKNRHNKKAVLKEIGYVFVFIIITMFLYYSFFTVFIKQVG